MLIFPYAMLSFFRKSKSPLKGLDPLPVPVPQLQGAEIAALSYAQRQGGDFYDFLRVSPHRLLFGLLDVAGHLEQTRPVLAAVQAAFRDSGPELFADQEANQADAMVELCLRLNRSIMQAAGGVRSCPAFLGCYDENLGTICYTNAGHTPGMVRDNTGIAVLNATALPLGLFPYATSDAPMTALSPGAALLLVSRGLVEGQCGGEEFGLDRAQQAFLSAATGSARDLGAHMLRSIQDYMCTPPTHNDVTALALLRGRM